MTNSNTAHSKALRAATATAAKSDALKSGKKKMIQMLGNAELVDYVRLNLQEVPGETALKKFKFLIDFYKKTNKALDFMGMKMEDVGILFRIEHCLCENSYFTVISRGL